MVQNSDIHQSHGIFKVLDDGSISLTRLSYVGGVIMAKYNCCTLLSSARRTTSRGCTLAPSIVPEKALQSRLFDGDCRETGRRIPRKGRRVNLAQR